MKKTVSADTLVTDARAFANAFPECEISLIIIDGNGITEFHSHNPRQTLDRYSDCLVAEENRQDPFAGDEGDSFMEQKNALFRDTMNFGCGREELNYMLVCFDSKGALYDYSQPDALDVMKKYYDIGGETTTAPRLPPQPLLEQPNNVFNLFSQYSESILAQEQRATEQQQQLQDMEKAHNQMTKALREKDAELNALRRAMDEIQKLNLDLEDKVFELQAENSRLRDAIPDGTSADI
uniref:Uncharacterized protein n=1 Tax=Eutreptiella gymnastica TaxID=73025 RepID=A0A7S4G1H1_9EUGL